MSQTMTVKIKLNPNELEEELITRSSLTYIKTVNSLVSEMVKSKETTKKSSKDVKVSLNSSVKNQAIRDAKSVFKKVKKDNFKNVPILRKPVTIWNNQNFTVCEHGIKMPFVIDGKSKKIEISATISDYEHSLLNKASKVGTLRVTKKGNKYIAQIAIEIPEPINTSVKTMGVDLGIKIPAVCCTNDNEVKFVGNGRMNKYDTTYLKEHVDELYPDFFSAHKIWFDTSRWFDNSFELENFNLRGFLYKFRPYIEQYYNENLLVKEENTLKDIKKYFEIEDL